ncbi:hypothetical protein B0H14DRAFT_2959115, partial [Mycena olivaceomarginata]
MGRDGALWHCDSFSRAPNDLTPPFREPSRRPCPARAAYAVRASARAHALTAPRAPSAADGHPTSRSASAASSPLEAGPDLRAQIRRGGGPSPARHRAARVHGHRARPAAPHTGFFLLTLFISSHTESTPPTAHSAIRTRTRTRDKQDNSRQRTRLTRHRGR